MNRELKETIAKFISLLNLPDPGREGLKDTPSRMAKAWEFWTSGYDQDASDFCTMFSDGSENYDEMILVKDIPVYSHCEHHLAPFFGVAHVGYIPKQRIIGLSKMPRIVDLYSRRLQVQERLTTQIAGAIHEVIHPVGVAVVLECRHLCMESRGIQRAGVITITSAMEGCFRDDNKSRSEFLNLIKRT